MRRPEPLDPAVEHELSALDAALAGAPDADAELALLVREVRAAAPRLDAAGPGRGRPPPPPRAAGGGGGGGPGRPPRAAPPPRPPPPVAPAPVVRPRSRVGGRRRGTG